MPKSKTVSLSEARISKNTRIYAIGDVHGCLRELNKLWKKIQHDLEDRPIAKHKVIFVGDYVDRGPECKAVIEKMISWQEAGEPITFIRGNHDYNFLRVINGIDERGLSGFIRYGGLATLESYGLSEKTVNKMLGENPGREERDKLSKWAKKAVGKSHIKFFENLVPWKAVGDFFFCHAGVQPERKLSDQDEYDLIWMREPFLSWNKPLQKVVVHGHTYRDEPETEKHRINLDTGCVYGGKLTALVLEGGKRRFLQVKSKFER